MSVKFTCNVCDKPIWSEMDERQKATTTILEAEQTAFCSDCINKVVPGLFV